ncbi:MAG: tetratricopeptide repeat protein [Thermoguttaceae bacterium]|nr:tetratricopeptide repeat protein [Thermoguttaceae bacterium]
MSALPVLNVFPRRPSKRRRLARLATSTFSLGTALTAALFVASPPFESPRLAVFAQTSQTTQTTQTAATTQPEDAALAAALEQHRQGAFAEAVRQLEAFIAQYPSSVNRNKAEFFAGHSHLALGGYVDPAETALARRHFQYVINQGKDAQHYKEATFHNAHSYFNLRQYSEARPLFVKFLTEFPNDAFVQYVYYYLGVCEAQSGAYAAALNYFDRNLKEYPTSPLRWTCRLEKAATIGKSGDYQEAEKQLDALAAEPEIPADVAGQVVVQRALLQIVQQNFDEAIRILDEFIQNRRNDPNSAQSVQDAYLYEAYSYFAKKEFERALLLVEQMQGASQTISPETALLKIKLLVNLNRLDEATDLLNKLENSSYGQDTPDAIASYRALISLARGDWDAAISSLTTLLKVRPTTGNAVALNYYNAGTPTGTQLAPHDFVEACGALILSHASRYAAKKAPADEAAQAAIFNATANYARSLNDPALDLIVDMIDKRRREALTKPIASGSGGVSVATPPGSVAPPPNPLLPPTAAGVPQQGGASYAPGGTQNGTTAPNAGTQSGTTVPNAGTQNGATREPTPLTPVAAREALDKATNFFVNQEYDRANETLLEAMTVSETFWQDCPAEAARVALLRANVLYALNKRSEAQLMCQDLLSNAPHSREAAVAAFYLGSAADLLGRRDDAIKYLRRAANARDDSPYADVALYRLALNEWERGDVKRAQENFLRLYRGYRESVYWSHALWALAKIEFDAKNDVVAEELVNEALAKKPDAAIVDYLLFLKGEIALRTKDYEKANVAFEMIIEQYPRSVWRSKATNRLNAIPEWFRNPDAAVPSPDASASSARSPSPVPRRELRDVDGAVEPTPRPRAPRSNASNGAELPPNFYDERENAERRLPNVSAGSPSDRVAPRPNARPAAGSPADSSSRPNVDRRPPSARPGGGASERSNSNVSRYPSDANALNRRREYVRYDERAAQNADERRVYRTSFSNETLRF